MTLKGGGAVTVNDDVIKGTLRVGSTVEVKQDPKKDATEAVITKIQDCSQYTVGMYQKFNTFSTTNALLKTLSEECNLFVLDFVILMIMKNMCEKRHDEEESDSSDDV